MKKQDLVDAIRRSGGRRWPLEEVGDFWPRLELLQNTGRYGDLLASITAANDKNNFLALVLETNFAYQFEAAGRKLAYEIKQDTREGSSIDFLRRTPENKRVFFEIRLLQQRQSIADFINSQLEKYGIYQILFAGEDEREEVIRLQNTVLSKVQDKRGNPIKFFSTDADVVNIVVIDATQSILGAFDIFDCMLVAYGDPSVEEVYRRQVFGLFQNDQPQYPQAIHDLAAKFAHMRNTLHGVLFLFKKPGGELIAYQLEEYLMWNHAKIDQANAGPILADISAVIPVRADE